MIILNNNIISADEKTFHKEVLESDKLVLVDFWAAWCGPCRMVSPIIEQIASEYQDKLKVVKVNVDENTELASQYDIMSIPTVYLFKDGKKVDVMIGVRPKQVFENIIKKYI